MNYARLSQDESHNQVDIPLIQSRVSLLYILSLLTITILIILVFTVLIFFTLDYTLVANSKNLDRKDESPSLIEISLRRQLSGYRRLNPTWNTLFGPLDESVSELPLCGIITSKEMGQWSLNKDNDLHFNLLSCRLRRPTHDEAHRCLSSQSLIFLGDSLTRYQYMSLITFLTKGDWPEMLGGLPGQPNPILEREYGNWPNFYNLTASESQGKETCSCHRDPNGYDTMYERRHYYEEKSDLTVRSFLLVVPETLLIGINEVQDEWKRSKSTRNHYSYTGRSLASIVVESCLNSTHPSCFYPKEVPYRPATVLIANTGLWHLMGIAAQPFNLQMIADSLGINPIPFRAIWKTTSPRKQEGNSLHSNMFKHPWEIWDIIPMLNQSIPRLSYIDEVHFLPFVYQEMNIVLLNMLCDANWKFK